MCRQRRGDPEICIDDTVQKHLCSPQPRQSDNYSRTGRTWRSEALEKHFPSTYGSLSRCSVYITTDLLCQIPQPNLHLERQSQPATWQILVDDHQNAVVQMYLSGVFQASRCDVFDCPQPPLVDVANRPICRLSLIPQEPRGFLWRCSMPAAILRTTLGIVLPVNCRMPGLE